MADVGVAVVGDGPAGSALAGALRRCEVDVVLVGPDRPWTAVYGTWADDVESIDWLRDVESIWAHRVEAIAVEFGGRRAIDRPYGIVDNDRLRARLRHGLEHRVTTVETMDPAGGGPVLRLGDGATLCARVVVDATGWPGRLVGAQRIAPDVARQTAFGVVLADSPGGPLGGPTLMDFRSPPGIHGDGIGPSFAYSVPVGDGWLLEETVLAARPAVPPDRLADRLAARLGTTPSDLVACAVRSERVDIPMGTPIEVGAGPVIAFGATAGMVHPATGYSIATSLGAADRVATAVAEQLARRRPDHDAIRDAVWPVAARRTRVLHDYGLSVLLGQDPTTTRRFFTTFFDLATDAWSDYLRIDTPPQRIAAVMAQMFRGAPWSLRRRLVSANPLAFARLFRP